MNIVLRVDVDRFVHQRWTGTSQTRAILHFLCMSKYMNFTICFILINLLYRRDAALGRALPAGLHRPPLPGFRQVADYYYYRNYIETSNVDAIYTQVMVMQYIRR